LVKRTIFTLLQFLAFCGLLYVGGYWDAIRLGQEVRALTAHTTFWNPIPTITYPISSGHILIANGILFASLLLVVLLLWQAFRRTLRSSAPYTLLAFAVAVALCFAFKVGLPPAS
jgi:hypothetical protein